jgi:hypothetical protein
MCDWLVLKLWCQTPLRWGVLDTTLCDKVCQCPWFSPVFSTKKNWPPRYNWNIVESGVKHHNLYPHIFQATNVPFVETRNTFTVYLSSNSCDKIGFAHIMYMHSSIVKIALSVNTEYALRTFKKTNKYLKSIRTFNLSSSQYI